MGQYLAMEAPHSEQWDKPWNSFRTPPNVQVALMQILQACGATFKKTRVRILSAEEGHYVRAGFTKKKKTEHWQILVHQKRIELERLYPRIKADNLDLLFRQQVAAFNNMDLHHRYQIMTCPIDRSPYNNWEKTLDWWREVAHYDLAATDMSLHSLVHRVQDFKIEQAFGRNARSGTRASGASIGELEIATLPGDIWDYSRPGLRMSAERILAREAARKAELRERIEAGQVKDMDDNVIRLPLRPAFEPQRRYWHPLLAAG